MTSPPEGSVSLSSWRIGNWLTRLWPLTYPVLYSYMLDKMCNYIDWSFANHICGRDWRADFDEAYNHLCCHCLHQTLMKSGIERLTYAEKHGYFPPCMKEVKRGSTWSSRVVSRVPFGCMIVTSVSTCIIVNLTQPVAINPTGNLMTAGWCSLIVVRKRR